MRLNIELVSQFTDDVTENNMICQQSACSAFIPKGAPYFYIFTANPSKSDHYVSRSQPQLYMPMAPDGIQGHVASNPQPVVTAHLPDPKVIQPPVHSKPPQNVAAVPCVYTLNHVLYGSKREQWACLAYCTPPAETIMLDISALYEGGSRRSHLHGTPFSSICEGKKDINAHITTPELVSIALTTIIPKIHAFYCNCPYFYGECIQPGTCKNAKSLVFMSKQFSLYVVIPAMQWKDYENFIETVSMDYATKPHQPVINLPSTQAHLVDSFSSVAEWPISHDVHIAEAKSQSQASSGNQLFVNSEKCDNPSPSPTMTNQCTPSKHNYQASISVSSVITISPPRKKVVHCLVPSPDHNKVIEALACGGTADMDVKKVLKMKLKSIVFYPIPTLPLEDILENSNKHSFQINPHSSHPGQLIFNTSMESLLDTGDGNLKDKSTIQIGHYILQQELEKLFQEANVLYWSQSLMKMTYKFIDHAIAASPTPPPFLIPCLHFVDAGLALAYTQAPESTSISASLSRSLT
ncbi:hypothetical protein BKA82DRAFT_4015567 [Pisolithus tinctorius]|nr:hypothetical protein BKA82DRAFT_4015567 [Pisolithus tinctorius]